MSMPTFYINRAGKSLGARRRKPLGEEGGAAESVRQRRRIAKGRPLLGERPFGRRWAVNYIGFDMCFIFL